MKFIEAAQSRLRLGFDRRRARTSASRRAHLCSTSTGAVRVRLRLGFDRRRSRTSARFRPVPLAHLRSDLTGAARAPPLGFGKILSRPSSKKNLVITRGKDYSTASAAAKVRPPPHCFESTHFARASSNIS
jgi:hypothetical protein